MMIVATQIFASRAVVSMHVGYHNVDLMPNVKAPFIRLNVYACLVIQEILNLHVLYVSSKFLVTSYNTYLFCMSLNACFLYSWLAKRTYSIRGMSSKWRLSTLYCMWKYKMYQPLCWRQSMCSYCHMQSFESWAKMYLPWWIYWLPTYWLQTT